MAKFGVFVRTVSGLLWPLPLYSSVCCFVLCIAIVVAMSVVSFFRVVHKHLWVSRSRFSKSTNFYSGKESCVLHAHVLVLHKLPPSFRFSPTTLVKLSSYHKCCKAVSLPYALCKYGTPHYEMQDVSCNSGTGLERLLLSARSTVKQGFDHRVTV